MTVDTIILLCFCRDRVLGLEIFFGVEGEMDGERGSI